ncbi:MAG: hypothetical protein IJ685_07940 [Selenomonadaceae bacterium]|nr:hypothetical protein [Selenomonadaceae bacterium]
MAAKKFHPTNDVNFSRWNSLNLQTKYYNTNIHVGAFSLPTYVIKALRAAE